jgi:ketosteroid isomerase-like protein
VNVARPYVGALHAAPLRPGAALMTIVMLLTGCVLQPVKPSKATAAQFAVIQNYIAALNRRDVLPLTAYVTPDFEWVSMVDGERVVEVSSREALTEMLRVYFERNQSPSWRIEAVNASGSVVAVTERAEWIENGAAQARNSLGVYELQDGRIRRATYFLSE